MFFKRVVLSPRRMAEGIFLCRFSQRHRRSEGNRKVTPSTHAREAAGLTLEQAAQRARVGIKYLSRVEKHGGASYTLAQRLCVIYRCSLNVFLFNGGERESATTLDTPPSRNRRRRQSGQKGPEVDTQEATAAGRHLNDA